MPLPVTALYAALLALVGIVLAGFVGRARVAADVSLGDGGKPALIEAMRRHANFAEFVPLFLVLLAIVELNGAAKWWLHTLGAVMVISRIIHPFGLRYDRMNTPQRMVGIIGTFATTVAVSITALSQVLR